MIIASPPLRRAGYSFVSIKHSEKNRCENEVKIVCAFPKLKTTAKSVQTTAEVCADYS